MKKYTRKQLELPTKIVKIAPHTYKFNGGGPAMYSTRGGMMIFNEAVKKLNKK